jgi:hemoglobin
MATAPDTWVPSENDTPFERLGGEDAVRQLVEHFYDAMSDQEPALCRLHACDEHGRVGRETRDRFALFLVGWLGGPQTYMAQHGHPRLRMRHAPFPVDTAMRDAWIRSMRVAMDALPVEGGLRKYLEGRFSEVADFLRNRLE